MTVNYCTLTKYGSPMMIDDVVTHSEDVKDGMEAVDVVYGLLRTFPVEGSFGATTELCWWEIEDDGKVILEGEG